MFRIVLALGLIGNVVLFAAGIWRSIMRGEQAFHTLGDLIGSSGSLFSLWLWPLAVVLFAVLLAIMSNASKRTNKHYD